MPRDAELRWHLKSVALRVASNGFGGSPTATASNILRNCPGVVITGSGSDIQSRRLLPMSLSTPGLWDTLQAAVGFWLPPGLPDQVHAAPLANLKHYPAEDDGNTWLQAHTVLYCSAFFSLTKAMMDSN